MTVLQTLVTEKQPQLIIGSRQTNTWRNDQNVNPPYVAVLHRKTTKSQPYVAPWTTPSVTVVRNSYVHAQNCLRMLTVSKSEAETGNFWKQPWDSQDHIRTSDSDLKPGMLQFH